MYACKYVIKIKKFIELVKIKKILVNICKIFLFIYFLKSDTSNSAIILRKNRKIEKLQKIKKAAKSLKEVRKIKSLVLCEFSFGLPAVCSKIHIKERKREKIEKK
jgi:hypothetical protein